MKKKLILTLTLLTAILPTSTAVASTVGTGSLQNTITTQKLEEIPRIEVSIPVSELNLTQDSTDKSKSSGFKDIYIENRSNVDVKMTFEDISIQANSNYNMCLEKNLTKPVASGIPQISIKNQLMSGFITERENPFFEYSEIKDGKVEKIESNLLQGQLPPNGTMASFTKGTVLATLPKGTGGYLRQSVKVNLPENFTEKDFVINNTMNFKIEAAL